MTLTRREFITHWAQAGVALGILGGARAAPSHAAEQQPPAAGPAIPIVDAHQHLWDLTKLRLPWLQASATLNRNMVMKDYLEASDGLGIAKAVYMEVDADPADQPAEADYILDLCQQGKWPTCAAVLGGRPGTEGFRQYVTRFKGNPYVKGVRQLLRGPDAKTPFFLEKPFLDGIRLLGELGMSFDLCGPATGLPDAAKLVGLCPDTRFILDHCGGASVETSIRAHQNVASSTPEWAFNQWRQGIEQLAKLKNVVCKISGIVTTAPDRKWTPEDLAPVVNHCLDSFGPDRVMFAGDWPVCTRTSSLRQWVTALRQVVANRSESEQRKLWGENATRFYGLKG